MVSHGTLKEAKGWANGCTLWIILALKPLHRDDIRDATVYRVSQRAIEECLSGINS